MAWYDLGTVKVTVNSSTVTGAGTKWLAGARQGEAFVAPDGRLYEVLNIASDTSLTLTKPYRGATATGQPYALAPMQGYVKELADRAAELLPALSAMGSAAKGTLATSTIDPVPGRVMRNADWGFGGNSGAVADQDILKNPINGIYRSGSSDVGKPDGTSSGSSYFKFGWGGTYYGLLYASPVQDKFYIRTVNNAKPNAWKELMTVGQYGVGRSGADANLDIFPAADLNALGVGAGSYYYGPLVGDASKLPFDPNVTGYNAGVLFHRQAGTAGGQVAVSSSNRLGWRGRRAGAYHTWREAMYVGEYGFGGAQANPTSWDAQKTGWYYRSGAKPAWGGGGFFLDLAYNTTAFNSGLRISTDPYTDNFYMNGAVSGQKTFRNACKLVHDKNIVGDVGAGSVVDNGSNANGTWIRFADGTQICWSGIRSSSWVDRAEGNIWKSSNNSWTFPMAFIDTSAYVLTADFNTSDSSFWVGPGINRGTGYCDYKLLAAIRWDFALQVRLCAIGRWKA